MWLENHRHWQESAPKYLNFFFYGLGFHIGSDHWYWYWCLHINLASVVNCSGICFLPWKQDSLDFWFGSKIKTRLGTEHIIANYTMCFNSHQWFCQMQPKMLNQNFQRKLLKHSPSPDRLWSPRFHGGDAGESIPVSCFKDQLQCAIPAAGIYPATLSGLAHVK